jgi:hypothetical protein
VIFITLMEIFCYFLGAFGLTWGDTPSLSFFSLALEVFGLGESHLSLVVHFYLEGFP